MMNPDLLRFWEYQGKCEFVWAAETKYHSLADINNRNVFSHNSGGWKSKVKVSAGLVSPEAPLSLQMLRLLSVLLWSFLCVCAFLVLLSLWKFLSYKDISQID